MPLIYQVDIDDLKKIIKLNPNAIDYLFDAIDDSNTGPYTNKVAHIQHVLVLGDIKLVAVTKLTKDATIDNIREHNDSLLDTIDIDGNIDTEALSAWLKDFLTSNIYKNIMNSDLANNMAGTIKNIQDAIKNKTITRDDIRSMRELLKKYALEYRTQLLNNYLDDIESNIATKPKIRTHIKKKLIVPNIDITT